MLENCKNAKERWGGVSDIIDRWLKARQELIVQFCSISSTPELNRPEALTKQLEQLCQQLMDYVSAGHFEVYDQLVQEAKDFEDENGIALADEIMPDIEKTTAELVKFNDRFDVTEKSEQGLRLLVEDASQLGEVLEERFELEDVMIKALHSVHADQIA